MSRRFILIAALLSLICGVVVVRPLTAATTTTSTNEEPARRVLELEHIVVDGNSRLSDSAIIATLELSPQDTVNVAVLEEARLRLLNGQPLLRTVDFSTRPGSQRGLVILDVAVVERKAVIFETGYGHQDTYGWFLTLLGLRIDPAAANGTEFRFGLRLGFHIAGLDGQFERRGKPYGFGFGGKFHIYTQEQIFFGSEAAPTVWEAPGDSDYTRAFRQKIERSGAELYLLYTLRDSTRFTFGFHAENIRPESTFVDSEVGKDLVFTDFPISLRTDIKKTVKTGLVFRAVRNTRDRQGYPQSGSFSLLQMQYNSTAFGGDVNFGKAECDVRKYIGLGNWCVLSSRLSAGIVSKETPYYERFFIGGVYSVRGFRGLSLSPPSGSDGFIIANEEFRFPLIASAGDAPPRLTGLVFVDAGIGWERSKPFRSSDIEAAAGYGVRLRLPWVGTLGLDVGVPFTDGRTGDRFYVHGCLGFSF
ncbi:MAG: BamA/TamA family outer membrane protein [Candidatus Zixiibacteriota bacterium]